MQRVLTMNNGTPETILSPKDFEDLVDKHMGHDSANYYQNQIEHLSEYIRWLTDCIGDKDILAETEEVLQVHGY